MGWKPSEREDRTAHWLILRRYEHKDGGYFWSIKGWAKGENEVEALSNALGGESEAKRYAVLDWTQAKFFRAAPVVFEE